MKLDFDPRKNITKLDYLIMPLKTVGGMINNLLVIRSIVKNWPDVLMFRLGLRKANFIMELRSGLKIKISKPDDYFSWWWETVEGQIALLKQQGLDKRIKIDERSRLIEFDFAHKSISLVYNSDKQLVSVIGSIKQQFIEEQYKWLNTKDKKVIDIGANIGDSAIYFTLKGAEHVYAFEPFPYSYRFAAKNIKLNHMNSKITLLNEGCGSKVKSIRIDEEYQSTIGSDLKAFKIGRIVKITTLSSAIKRFNIHYPAILKIDCEGCEYDVLLKTPISDLRKFERIIIEYHYGYKNLKKRLNIAGFKITKTWPYRTIDIDAENRDMLIGLIYAERID